MRRKAAASLVIGLMLGCGSRSPLPEWDDEPEPGQWLLDAGVDADPRPDAEPEGCVQMSIGYESQPATVLLLVDRSGSMSDPFGAGTRWSALGEALFEPNDGVIPRMQGAARFGMILYTSRDGYAGGDCPMLIEVPIALDDADEIERAWSATWPEPDGDTPTGEAIAAATRTLTSFGEPGPRYLVLVTDGEPDTCAVPDPQTGQSQAIAAATAAHQAGIELLVLGLSDDVARHHLQQMANAGTGAALNLEWGVDDGAARPYHVLDDPSDLAGQLRGLLGAVRSCVVELDEAVDPELAPQASVVLDGQALAYLEPDGWTLLDEHTLEVHGAACDRLESTSRTLEIDYPCE